MDASSPPTPAVETEYPTGWKAPSAVEFTAPSSPGDGDTSETVPIVNVGDTPVPTAHPTLALPIKPKALDVTASLEGSRLSGASETPSPAFALFVLVLLAAAYIGFGRFYRATSGSSTSLFPRPPR